MKKAWRSAHFNEIVRRTLDASDPVMAAQFRGRLLEDPEGLVKAEGFDITEDEMNLLKSVTQDAVDRTARFVSSAVDQDPTTA